VAEPALDTRRLGIRLLALEEGGRGVADANAESAERVAGKMGHHLGGLIGVAGYQALLKRALHLASRELPYLAPIVDSAAEGSLDAVRAALRDVEPARAREALAEVFAQLLALLVTFIGQDLTLRTLRQVWPELEAHEDGPESQEASV
jgi:hypothetical protein